MLTKILELAFSEYLKIKEIEARINRVVKLAESINKTEKDKKSKKSAEKSLDK